MKTIRDLKDEVIEIAKRGKQATIEKNYKLVAQCFAELQQPLNELYELTGESFWKDNIENGRTLGRRAEIKAELIEICESGVKACDDENLADAKDTALKLEPLLRELAQLTGDQEWNNYADNSQTIVREINRFGH